MNKIAEITNSQYWNDYYFETTVPTLPSQFAVFVLSERLDSRIIIDIGCGNGRDTFFFREQGYRCVGIDNSKSAIKSCKEKIAANNLTNIEFLNASINDKDLDKKISDALGLDDYSNILIYGRFFLHAIKDSEEERFFLVVSKILKNRTGSVALEFRTERDRFQMKSTPDHFRRYINPTRFFSKAEKRGFEVEYFVEGFGLAKYKTDDAHVARFILLSRDY